MNQTIVLIRKELQENRGMFVFLPLVLSALMLAVILSGVTLSGIVDQRSFRLDTNQIHESYMSSRRENVAVQPFSGAAMQHLAMLSPEGRAKVLSDAYVGMSAPLLVALWIVVFIYPLGTLYGERKDRSVLFWKSMPVSDAKTVLVKLLCVTLLVPAIYLVCIMFVHTLALLVASISAARQSLPVWPLLWAPSHLPMRWLNDAGYLLLNSIWFLPMYAWLLLVSAWAKTLPAAWALVVPFALVLVERIFTPFDWFGHWVGRFAWPLGFSERLMLDTAGCLQLMLNGQMLISLAIAAAMLYGAIYMRGRTNEI